jgi:hypothetical protein
VTREGGRFRLNLEAFIASMLERMPLPELGRLVESIATAHAATLHGRANAAAWHHDGVMAFVEELAERLMPSAPGAPTAPGLADIDPRPYPPPPTRSTRSPSCGAEALLEDVEVWAHSSGTFPGELLAEVRRYLGPDRCGACHGGPPCLVHRKADDEAPR